MCTSKSKHNSNRMCSLQQLVLALLVDLGISALQHLVHEVLALLKLGLFVLAHLKFGLELDDLLLLLHLFSKLHQCSLFVCQDFRFTPSSHRLCLQQHRAGSLAH